MNTFKTTATTTACVLSLAAAGFAAENEHDSAPNTPVQQHHVNNVTPVQAVAALHIATPPQNVQFQPQYFTPQGQMIQPVTPARPARLNLHLHLNAATPNTPHDSAIDRLVGSATASSPFTAKRKISEETIVAPKGKVIYSTAQKMSKGSKSIDGYESPTDVATGMTRLESDMLTPAARQFNTNKNMPQAAEVDPSLEDNQELDQSNVNNSTHDGENIEHNISGVQDVSIGLPANFANDNVNNSAVNDSSFVIRTTAFNNGDADEEEGAEEALENDVSVISGADSEEDAEENLNDNSLNISVISGADSEEDNDLDMGYDVNFSDEEENLF